MRIEEIHGRPVKAGQSSGAAHVVGVFDSIDEMNAVHDRDRGRATLEVNEQGWRPRPQPEAPATAQNR